VSRIDTLPEEFFRFLSTRPLALGDIVGSRFRLTEELGRGGMGQVFTAENLAIGRLVAVKVLKPELLADPAFRARFQREAMAIASVEHRNVVRFFDLVVGDPTFLVMEYVRGPTLSAVLREHKRLDIARAVNLATRLGWALDAVHRAGLIHRDVKPSNIILSPDAELGEEPKLIDFGLAKLAHAPAEDALTRTGQLVGTPYYMSPEQIGNREPDARSDIYSFGCLLYHLLAGRPPFSGQEEMQILYQQVHNEPDALHRHAPHVPAELEAIVMRAIRKDLDQRFSSMREVIDALATVERRSSPTPAAPPPPKRGRLRLAVGATAGVLALGAAVAWPRLVIRSGAVLVLTSHPQEARVYLDGKLLPEPTPTAARGVASGPHRLRFEAAGREPIEQTVELAAGARMAVDAPLPPVSRAVPVTSVPAGATVFLDGNQIPGETPLTLSLTDDDFHELRVEKLGFEPEKKGVAPEERGPLVVPLTPELRPRGRIWVDSNGTAEVLIDGKDTSYTTPTLGITVAVGEHHVGLRDSTGQTTASKTVQVRAGEAIHLTLSPPGSACKDKPQ
jgi:tRNA A-37 threonylcarbamoyl transferase component Bud32